MYETLFIRGHRRAASALYENYNNSVVVQYNTCAGDR